MLRIEVGPESFKSMLERLGKAWSTPRDKRMMVGWRWYDSEEWRGFTDRDLHDIAINRHDDAIRSLLSRMN